MSSESASSARDAQPGAPPEPVTLSPADMLLALGDLWSALSSIDNSPIVLASDPLAGLPDAHKEIAAKAKDRTARNQILLRNVVIAGCYVSSSTSELLKEVEKPDAVCIAPSAKDILLESSNKSGNVTFLVDLLVDHPLFELLSTSAGQDLIEGAMRRSIDLRTDSNDVGGPLLPAALKLSADSLKVGGGEGGAAAAAASVSALPLPQSAPPLSPAHRLALANLFVAQLSFMGWNFVRLGIPMKHVGTCVGRIAVDGGPDGEDLFDESVWFPPSGGSSGGARSGEQPPPSLGAGGDKIAAMINATLSAGVGKRTRRGSGDGGGGKQSLETPAQADGGGRTDGKAAVGGFISAATFLAAAKDAGEAATLESFKKNLEKFAKINKTVGMGGF